MKQQLLSLIRATLKSGFLTYEEVKELFPPTPLNPMETAPKDKPILLDVGLPYLVVGVWHQVHKEWVYEAFHMDSYNGELVDAYFESEYEKEPLGWLPIPDK